MSGPEQQAALRLELSGLGVAIEARSIVAGIDLCVEPGEFVALVGPNGSGKSTVLRTVYRALRPTAGVVRIGGDDLWRLPARDAARRRSVVPQHSAGGADFTVAELAAMGRTPHKGPLDRDTRADRDIVAEALERVGLGWARHRPVSTLSGGERQRAMLARALAQQAPLIVLDEPTNHLDVRAQLDLLTLIRSLGVSTLAALHDLNHATAHADRVVVLHDGRLVAGGPPLEVLTPALIRTVFGVRAHVGTHPLTGSPHIALAALDPEDQP